MSLETKIRAHDWSADPDNHATMIDRLEILQAVKAMSLVDLTFLLQSLPQEFTQHIVRMIEDYRSVAKV